MDYSIINDVSSYFLDIDYQVIQTDSDNVKMFGCFKKSSLYLINIIALHDEYRFDKDLFEEYKKVTRNQFSKIETDKVILLNLFFTEGVDRIYTDINYCPETEDDFIDINWIINTSTRELVIPDKQINNLLGLEKTLPKVIGEEEFVVLGLEQRKKVSYITYVIMLINLVVFVAIELTGSSLDAEHLIASGALYTGSIIYDNEFWRLGTSMFIHIGYSHLAFNTLALYIFGGRLEKYLTSFQYITVYLVSGLMGGGISLVINIFMGQFVIAAGASGAIYGLVGSIYIYSQLTQKHIEGLNSYIVGIYLLVGVVVSEVTKSSSISAHVGGFICGILVTLTFISIKNLKNNDRKIDAK